MVSGRVSAGNQEWCQEWCQEPFLPPLREGLAQRTTTWQQRKLRVAASTLGYSAGVLDAAAVAAAGLAGNSGD